MASFNKVILLGNLTRDPEVRYTTGGSAVCDITLAVNYQWTDKRSNERKEEVSCIDVTLWGRTAEIAGEYLGKGRPVLIEGRLQQDKWDDKETGQKRSKLKVVADAMQLLGGKAEGGGGGGGGNATPKSNTGRPAAAPTRSNDSYGDSDSGRTPDQTFYDDMPPSGGDDVPF
jgi:single-strand DNA-binding protein